MDGINSAGTTTDRNNLDVDKLSTYPTGSNEFVVVVNNLESMLKKRVSDRLVLYEPSLNNIKLLTVLDIREENKEVSSLTCYFTN